MPVYKNLSGVHNEGLASDNVGASFMPGTYTNINSNATTVVKSGGGVLHSILINKAGAASNTATVYDNTAGSGTVIALIDTTIAGTPTRIYDVIFTTGLTIVTATGTAADLTVSTL